MCISECIIVFAFILGIFVFIFGGYLGKYIYYLGHPQPSIDDVPWLWRNSGSFFAWDALFVFWGVISIAIYILILVIVVFLLKGLKKGICCVVKAPYTGAKYLLKPKKKGSLSLKPLKKKKNKKKCQSAQEESDNDI